MRRTWAWACAGMMMAGCAGPGAAGARGAAPGATASSPGELLDRGRAFAAVGDLTRAEQYLSAALDAGVPAGRILPTLVRVCTKAGRYRVAGEYVRECSRRDPENMGLHLLLGSLEAAVGERETALRDLEIVLKARPDDADGHYAMAVLLRDAWEDPAGADAQFRAYLQIAPAGPHAPEARASLSQEMP